ncbi:MAG: 50S ribosomal protein L13 [Patescibacteria group bacterium]
MDYNIDAKDKKLGRVASEIAGILQGKKSPAYNPSVAGSDKVFVKNYRHITLSGKKADNKIYYRHTGYVGHLKEEKFKEVFAKDPKRVLRESVRRMLPKNFLNKKRILNLVFVDNDNESKKA